MISFYYMEPLLCRFTKSQRAKIRKEAKKWKVSEAGYVRLAINEFQKV